MRPIRIALTKGRLEDKTVEMLERLGRGPGPRSKPDIKIKRKQ